MQTTVDVLAHRVAAAAEPFEHLETASLRPLLDRIGEARLVLIGEASHGTSEFYRMRARITQELITRRRFTFVALEADWPDAARIDRYTAGVLERTQTEAAFSRFPTWMWRNREVLEFVTWLRAWNEISDAAPTGVHGLDLYSLYASQAEVIRYLDRVDPELASMARNHYSCLSPFVQRPQDYGYASLSARFRDCEDKVAAVLLELRERAGELTMADGRSFLDAERNARVVSEAERYYRTMFHGGAASWNLRDRHMFDTLEALLDFYGPGARGVVWAHNSHLGDASATEMAERGELNLGQLVRERHGPDAYLIGFGTDHGTVAAASDWDAPVEIKRVRPSHPDSYERVCHESGVDRFLLPTDGAGTDPGLADALRASRLERAIGVIYRPDTERLSHYFEARLSDQFDEWIWFDESSAVQPLTGIEHAPSLAEGHPFAPLDV